MTHEPTYHPLFERLVDLFVSRTNNPSRPFFRTQIAYFLGLVAANMRVSVSGWSGTKIPVNIYAINLSPSGAGKGYSTSVLENEILGTFRDIFMESTYALSTQINLAKVATKRAIRNSTDESDELIKLEKEFNQLGAYLLTFDSATVAAIKQLRHQVQMANAGSINFIMDEIGANLLGQAEVLNLFLELYDMGNTKEKLVKSTVENIRTERFTTATPTNMLLFGEPTSLLNGAATEAKFFQMLSMGYARRCIFGYVEHIEKDLNLTPEDMLEQMNSNTSNQIIEDLSVHFAKLAQPSNLNAVISIEKPQALKLMTYKLECERVAATYPDHENIRKAETEHRYFKVMKLAGAYAFFDGAPSIMDEHLDYAITMVETSGEHFKRLITPVRPYVKLAKYLAQCHPSEMTMADLDRDLPYLPSNKAAREEMFAMASAWGYKNSHVIRRTSVNGINFFSGQSLEKTDLDKMILTYSQDMTTGYVNRINPFSQLKQLFQLPNKRHWLNHHLNDGYRIDTNVIKGFNMLVLDVDGDCPLVTAQTILSKYTYIIHTTKSHNPGVQDRYRIILPINYVLYLDTADYKEMMKGIVQELPLIKMDESGNHRVKKWETNPQCTLLENTGELFDILPFIPNTTKSEERIRKYSDQSNLDGLERWVLNTSEEGNRNNTLFRYGMILVDLGKDFNEIVIALRDLNSKLTSPLDEAELNLTVINSVTRKMLHNNP